MLHSMDKMIIPLGNFITNNVIAKISNWGFYNLTKKHQEFSNEFSKVFTVKSYSFAALHLIDDLKKIYPEHQNYLEQVETVIKIPAYFHEVYGALSLIVGHIRDSGFKKDPTKGLDLCAKAFMMYLSCSAFLNTIQNFTPFIIASAGENGLLNVTSNFMVGK